MTPGALDVALPVALIRSETTKFFTSRPIAVLSILAVAGTWPMAWLNAASGVGIEPDDPRLYSAEPIAVAYRGFEMAAFGYVLIVAIAAIWARQEHGPSRQFRTTLLATPNRLAVVVVKATILAVWVAVVAFLTMWGTIVITHAVDPSGADPWALNADIWRALGGVVLAWVLTALTAFSIGSMARSAVLPLTLLVPLVMGVGDLLVGLWPGAAFLPVAAGSALYTDAAIGTALPATVGGLVAAAWAAALFIAASLVAVRRDA